MLSLELESAMERRGVAVIESQLRRERQPYHAIAARPLSPLIGAEIEGLDLGMPLRTEEKEELRRAFLEHHVLVFRDQHIDGEDHRRIMSLLGEPEPGRREVTLPANDDDLEPVMLADSWRADETFRLAPPAGASLHVHRLPRLGAGGDMMFANMHLAYDLLSEPLKALLPGLTAVHRRDPEGLVSNSRNETAEHPIVVRHPVTGRPTIFVNRRHTSHIVQLQAEESRATLDMLFRHLESTPVLTCRVRWTPNALVLWDNRSTQHLTLQDFRPTCLLGHMTSMAGGPPVRFDPDASSDHHQSA